MKYHNTKPLRLCNVMQSQAIHFFFFHDWNNWYFNDILGNTLIFLLVELDEKINTAPQYRHESDIELLI